MTKWMWLIAGALWLQSPALADVSSQSNPEAPRKFEKTEFEAVVKNIKKDKQQITVEVEGIEYRLTASKSNLTMLKTGDKVKVYLRGNGEDKIAWKVVKK